VRALAISLEIGRPQTTTYRSRAMVVASIRPLRRVRFSTRSIRTARLLHPVSDETAATFDQDQVLALRSPDASNGGARPLALLSGLWLAEQYVAKRHSMGDIGAEAGLRPSTIKGVLHNHGIRRVRRGPTDIDRDWLRTQYVVKRRGVKEIGVESDTSASTVSRAVSLHGLQRAGRRQGPLGLSDPAWLRGRYIGDGATADDIANELGVPTSAVRNSLRRHSITR